MQEILYYFLQNLSNYFAFIKLIWLRIIIIMNKQRNNKHKFSARNNENKVFDLKKMSVQ